MQEILTVLVMGMLDRVRGDSFGVSKGAEQTLYGLFVAVFAVHLSFIHSLLFAACFVLGSSIGWGGPLGAYLAQHETQDPQTFEWWQVSILKTNLMLALIFRGFLWGFPLIVLSYFLDNQLIGAAGIAYILAFPLAITIARKRNDAWELQEWLRGFLAGALIILFGL